MPSMEFLNRKGSVWERYDVGGHSIEEARREMDQMAIDDLKSYEDVIWEPGSCGALSGKWVRPQNPIPQVLYYIHGGGFTHGSSGIPLPFLMELSHRLHITCFSADYRLAPEYTFPAAPEDALKGYQGLLDLGYRPDQILVCGESAGANLALVLPLMCKTTGIEAPRAIIALSPVTDNVGVEDATVLEGLNKPDEVFRIYAPTAEKDDPLASPLYGDLNGFPDTFIIAGCNEPLTRDAIVFAEKAAYNNVDIRLHVGKDMIHTYPLDLWDYPEAMEAFEEIELFVKQKIR